MASRSRGASSRSVRSTKRARRPASGATKPTSARPGPERFTFSRSFLDFAAHDFHEALQTLANAQIEVGEFDAHGDTGMLAHFHPSDDAVDGQHFARLGIRKADARARYDRRR